MIILKIRLKSEDKSFTKTLHVDDSFAICKANDALKSMVEEAVLESHIEDIEDCIINANFEW